MSDRREPPELPVALLADLDAGLLDPARAAEVRAAAAADPDAAAVLAGLAATRAELAALADPPVPEEVVARWDAALAAGGRATGPGDRAHPASAAPDDAAPDGRPGPMAADRPEGGAGSTGLPAPEGGTVHDHSSRRRPAPASRRPPRGPSRRRLRPALLAAAVLAAAAVAGALWIPREPARSAGEVDLVREGLAVRGDFDVGELADPARRAACLRAVAPRGVAPDAPLLGGRDVVVQGREGVLLLLAAGGRGRLHVVVVTPGCGPDSGALLGAETIG